MSTYAFDLDGVLDKPAMKQLATDLFKAGHRIIIVTGGLSDTGEWTEQARLDRLEKLGISHYTYLIRCMAPTFQEIGQLKNDACNKYQAIIIFDDVVLYLDQIGPETQRCLVL